MSMHIVRAVKKVLLPAGPRFRRLPLGPARGCVMKIDFHHHLRLYLGLYERELEPHFRALVRPGDRCFDVGGQGGYDALLLCRLSGGAPVVSFECDGDAVREMRETFARNPSCPIDTIDAFVDDTSDAGHITLDAAVASTFVPDFVKMDIEGAEVLALEGARTLLSTRKPKLIIEVHGVEIEARCREMLASHGYSVVTVDQRGRFKEHRPLAHNRWLVCT